MEAVCAESLWSRSADNHQFRYTTILFDGDSKAYDAVNKLAVYGTEFIVEKEDCINHVQKRIGSSLRNVLSISKAQKDNISGKDKLTQEKITRIQNYYGRAIKDYASDIQVLKKRIMAILIHLSSTDSSQIHVHCAPRNKSWCFWQRVMAK